MGFKRENVRGNLIIPLQIEFPKLNEEQIKALENILMKYKTSLQISYVKPKYKSNKQIYNKKKSHQIYIRLIFDFFLVPYW